MKEIESKLLQSFIEKELVKLQVFLKIPIKCHGKMLVKKSKFNKFKSCIKFIFSFSYSDLKWCNLYIYSHVNIFAGKLFWWKNGKTCLEILIIIFPHCISANPNSKLPSQKCSYTRYLTREILSIFAFSKKLAFRKDLFSEIRQRYLFYIRSFS